jgi:hypothetical protein
MYITNSKVLVIPYAIILYMLIFAGVITFSAKMVTGMIMKMNIENSVKNTATAILQQTKNTNPSVVELFTSEGCSSCPSADKLVAIAQKEFNENTIVLSYHVDYWDRLGWKDPFSKAAYTDRQRQYAEHLNLQSVYTPQAIVNGKTEFVGSNKTALWNAISNYKNSDYIIIQTETPQVSNQQLSIKYNYAPLQTNENVVLELILKNATTQVKRGENGGATLSHINIVQDIVQKHESKGTVTFNLPANFAKENYMIVAFVQNKESFEITNAKKVSII